jgi:tetratricopeptide (TPR) repeat protein
MSKSDAAQLKSSIATSTRAVEYARRVANSDESKLEMLINHLHTLSLLREANFRVEEAQAHHRQKPNPLLAANVASSLGFLYDRWGKAPKAREWYGRSLYLAEVGGFMDSDLGASVSNNLGMIEKKSGKETDSEHHYRNAHRIFQLLKGPDSTESAAVLNNLGVLLYTGKRLPEALAAHTQALQIRQKHFDHISGAGEADLRQTWQNLAAVYKAQGDHEKAASLLRQAGRLEAPSETSSANWVVSVFRESDPSNPALAATHKPPTNMAQPAFATAGVNESGRQGFKVETFDID